MTLYLLVLVTKEYNETVLVLQLDIQFIGNIIEKKAGKALKEYLVHPKDGISCVKLNKFA